jgi:hypothetical protein
MEHQQLWRLEATVKNKLGRVKDPKKIEGDRHRGRTQVFGTHCTANSTIDTKLNTTFGTH